MFYSEFGFWVGRRLGVAEAIVASTELEVRSLPCVLLYETAQLLFDL